MHLPRPLRALGLLVAVATATVALWVASTPPATWIVAPGVTGRP